MIGNNIIVVAHHLYYMQYQRDLQWSRFFVFIQVPDFGRKTNKNK
jgi:hypothetical protein